MKIQSRFPIGNTLLVGIGIVVVIALVALVLWRVDSARAPLSAVYLQTGELYFGKLSRFPRLTLKQVYLLQLNRQNAQVPASIERFTSAFWGPSDTITLNNDQIVWIAPLDPDGELARLIATNPTLSVPQAQQPQQPQQQVQPRVEEPVGTSTRSR